MKRHIYFEGGLYQTDYAKRVGYAFKSVEPFGGGSSHIFDVATSSANAAAGIGVHGSAGPSATIVSGKLVDGWIINSRQDSFAMSEDEYKTLLREHEIRVAEAEAEAAAQQERDAWMDANMQSVEVSNSVYEKAAQWLAANGCPPEFAADDEYQDHPVDYRLPQFNCDRPMLSPTMTFFLYNVDSVMVERFKTQAEKIRIDALYAI